MNYGGGAKDEYGLKCCAVRLCDVSYVPYGDEMRGEGG